MAVTIPPPDERVTSQDFWLEPWYRAIHDMMVGINDAATIITSLQAFVAAPALPSYTVSTLPAATTAGRLIYVSNESGGATVAFSNGVNWLRVQDRAIVS